MKRTGLAIVLALAVGLALSPRALWADPGFRGGFQGSFTSGHGFAGRAPHFGMQTFSGHQGFHHGFHPGFRHGFNRGFFHRQPFAQHKFFNSGFVFSSGFWPGSAVVFDPVPQPVWIPGFWAWNGFQWVWIPGRWAG